MYHSPFCGIIDSAQNVFYKRKTLQNRLKRFSSMHFCCQKEDSVTHMLFYARKLITFGIQFTGGLVKLAIQVISHQLNELLWVT